ncbi:Wadjet anti-phage system protein JetA family protein [Bradyrhizobium sp. WSM1417]|uniref:Wadjet anti-phage system protein JetA family protein n=1 Tax=Bradyrhizobium sp. WSM1417 TaxID=754500 RepID=UPI00048A28FF|nr:Wadjet anti-phage system protein JetA family protein [Bradyrhizobium sp. WSM1417]
MKLFGYLPETVFKPLSGPKKHVYARLLMRLYERVYSARILETPLKEEVVRQIEIGLSEFGIGSMGDLSEGDPDEDQTTSQAHYLAYYRLRDTGWLTDETEKWRTYVDMNPDAFMVLGAITDFGNSRVRVASAVVDVKNNLEAANREPETMAQGLANAHDTASRFARSMRRILAGMREIEDRILGNPNAAAILRTFFQDFVDGLLIADYKQLKTSNNPYRHRRTIASLAGDMLADPQCLGKIARAYIEQGVMAPGASVATAEERVVAELEKIKSVFEDVGPFMDKIEDFRDRLERRIRTTVHYMDVMGEGAAERIVRLVEQISKVRSDDVEIRLRSPDVGLPITSLALYTPAPPKAPPQRTRFKLPKEDPYLRAYVQATTEFDRMVRVTDQKLLEFARRQMQGRDRVSSEEIEIGSIPDLFAYRAIPSLAAIGRSVRLGEFTITLEEGRSANDWIDVTAFRIERTRTTADAA